MITSKNRNRIFVRNPRKFQNRDTFWQHLVWTIFHLRSILQGLFDKYPCLSIDGTTDAKCVCHYLTPSFKRCLSKFQTDLLSKFVLIAVAIRQVRVCLQPWRKSNIDFFLYPPQRGYISFVNTFVTPTNNDLGPYVPWRHLISAKF